MTKVLAMQGNKPKLSSLTLIQRKARHDSTLVSPVLEGQRQGDAGVLTASWSSGTSEPQVQ